MNKVHSRNYPLLLLTVLALCVIGYGTTIIFNPEAPSETRESTLVQESISVVETPLPMVDESVINKTTVTEEATQAAQHQLEASAPDLPPMPDTLDMDTLLAWQAEYQNAVLTAGNKSEPPINGNIAAITQDEFAAQIDQESLIEHAESENLWPEEVPADSHPPTSDNIGSIAEDEWHQEIDQDRILEKARNDGHLPAEVAEDSHPPVELNISALGDGEFNDQVQISTPE